MVTSIVVSQIEDVKMAKLEIKNITKKNNHVVPHA